MSEVDDAIAETVLAIWESMLGTEIRRVDVASDDVHELALVGYIRVTGPEGGVVTLACSEALGRETASVIYRLPLLETGIDEAKDALGELTNIIGGNFKALLSEGHRLSLPTVTDGGEFRTTSRAGHVVARADFDCAGQRLEASFLRDEAHDVERV